jgi:cyclase
VYLDISRAPAYDLGRDDLAHENRENVLDILRDVARRCFMPLAFGGGIRTLSEIRDRVRLGADKVVLNTQPLKEPGFLDAAAREFGSQCLVVCIDARRHENGWQVFAEGGRLATGRTPAAWAREAADRGAGEILVQAVDRDGSGEGYDLDLIHEVCRAARLPVVALGGAGEWSQLEQALTAGASAVAAANIFSYSENSVYRAKRWLYEAGLDVREPVLARAAAA